MALHGTIQVNQESIGYFVARRLGPVEGNGPNEYEWEVAIGYKGCGGTLYHNYSDGAISLLSKVFQEAERLYENE